MDAHELLEIQGKIDLAMLDKHEDEVLKVVKMKP